jgi:hypothetical protein
MNSKHMPHPQEQLSFLGFPCIKMEAGQSADTRLRKEQMMTCQGNLNYEHSSMHHAVGHVSHHVTCIMQYR